MKGVMDNNGKTGIPRFWISYPWMNREERDFAYLVSQLKEANIDAVYESLQLSPDRHLQERAIQRLHSVGVKGWLYILTHQCFTRKECSLELTAVMQHAMRCLGPDFPMAGLLYGISLQHVPASLRIHPCISLADSNWKQQLLDIFKLHESQSGSCADDANFVWKIHARFCGDPSMTAIEVHSKDESIEYWRFAIPKDTRPIAWGQGPSGGRGLSHTRSGEASGSGKYANQDISWFGAADVISKTESAYIVFCGPLPEFICFGPAKGPFGPPGKMEVYWTAPINKLPQTVNNFVYRN
jgi:hypothetical protein